LFENAIQGIWWQIIAGSPRNGHASRLGGIVKFPIAFMAEVRIRECIFSPRIPAENFPL
jgi:hypothetical protein